MSEIQMFSGANQDTHSLIELAEATSFLEALIVEHSANDFYGVLDFYTPSRLLTGT